LRFSSVPGTLFSMKSVLKVLVAALAVGAVWIPREAFALGPVDLEIAAQVGGGTSTVGGGPNALGLGLGGRAGIDVFGFYAGVAAMYYIGDGGTGSDPNGNLVHTYASSSLVGLEGGYNIGLSMLTLRPQLGLGYYNEAISTSSPQGITMTSVTGQNSSSIYVEPGVTGLLSFGMWIVGADVGLLWVPAVDNSNAAVVVHGQFGIKL
jgi:hypothetical protein